MGTILIEFSLTTFTTPPLNAILLGWVLLNDSRHTYSSFHTPYPPSVLPSSDGICTVQFQLVILNLNWHSFMTFHAPYSLSAPLLMYGQFPALTQAAHLPSTLCSLDLIISILFHAPPLPAVDFHLSPLDCPSLYSPQVASCSQLHWHRSYYHSHHFSICS
jgi:hypothetical protein